MRKLPKNTNLQEAGSANLTLKQHYAMELLLVGKSDAEVAALIGVDSKVVQEWQSQDSAFIVAINTLRAAAWEGSVARLKSLMSQALDVVEEAVNRGDEMVAISFLQALGRENFQSSSSQLTDKTNVTRQKANSTQHSSKVRVEKSVQKMSLVDVSRF